MKVLLTGLTGTGKTHTALKFMFDYADKGAYLDLEGSALVELRLFEKELEKEGRKRKFAYINCKDFKEFYEMLKRTEGYLVVDAINKLTDYARLYARELFVKEQHYYMGEKLITITNPELFDLRGWLYQVPNRFEKDVIRLFNAKEVVVACANTDKSQENVAKYYPEFDLVLECVKRFDEQGVKYTCNLIKARGLEKEVFRLIKQEKEPYEVIKYYKEVIG